MILNMKMIFSLAKTRWRLCFVNTCFRCYKHIQTQETQDKLNSDFIYSHGGHLLTYLEDLGDNLLSTELKTAMSLLTGQTNEERAMVRARQNLVSMFILRP